jgi:NAD(P)-dependent dehydrogenase (short-subunit alcohol dehydrogenase family)
MEAGQVAGLAPLTNGLGIFIPIIRKGIPMARIFISGSSDGLGLLAARLLVKDGHQAALHARNDARAAEAAERCRSRGALSVYRLAGAVVVGGRALGGAREGRRRRLNAAVALFNISDARR